MLKVSLDRNGEQIARLMNAIFKENKVPSDWHDSYVMSLFKGKGGANVRGNYGGLKLAEHLLKETERVIKKYIKDLIKIGKGQFSSWQELVQMMPFLSCDKCKNSTLPNTRIYI